MFGYLIAMVLGIGLLGLVLIIFAGATRGHAPAGKPFAKNNLREKPVEPHAPAADAPTPDRSATASTRQVAAARKHTPPA